MPDLNIMHAKIGELTQENDLLKKGLLNGAFERINKIERSYNLSVGTAGLYLEAIILSGVEGLGLTLACFY